MNEFAEIVRLYEECRKLDPEFEVQAIPNHFGPIDRLQEGPPVHVPGKVWWRTRKIGGAVDEPDLAGLRSLLACALDVMRRYHAGDVLLADPGVIPPQDEHGHWKGWRERLDFR